MTSARWTISQTKSTKKKSRDDMKLTKEDYMRLPKERLAELLVERDTNEGPILSHRVFPFADPGSYKTPCYAPDGICTNPQMDCINCPRKGGGVWVTNSNLNKEGK